MTPKQRTTLINHMAREVSGARYVQLWEICESQRSISIKKLKEILLTMQVRDIQEANKLQSLLKKAKP